MQRWAGAAKMPPIRGNRAALVAVRLFPRIIFSGWGLGMSEDSKRWPAAKPNSSEGWGDPPIWSPWNFQFPKSNREDQTHVYREAHVNEVNKPENDDPSIVEPIAIATSAA